MRDEYKPRKQVTALQMATLLVLEGQVAQLQIGANQLGGFLGLKEEADVLISAAKLIDSRKAELQRGWDRKVQIVEAPVVPSIISP